MANEEHVKIVKQGAEAIAAWQAANPTATMDLREANLSGADLEGADLRRAKLKGAQFFEANLRAAKLFAANLSGADLRGAKLEGADLSMANLFGADLSGADLFGAKLLRAFLSGAKFVKADLRAAKLREADLSGADLSGADLDGTELEGSNVSLEQLSTARNITVGIESLVRTRAGEVKEREERLQRVTTKATEYIEPTKERLDKGEKHYGNIAYWLYFLAVIALGGSVCYAIAKALRVPDTTPEWPILVVSVVFGVGVIALLAALAKLFFVLGKSFMVESLRNADRRHAISFGEFLLKAYGDTLELDDVKQAFQHWNIDLGSGFLKQDAAQFDPKFLEKLVEALKVLSSVGALGANVEKAKAKDPSGG